MVRKPRVEFPGATHHVRNHESRGLALAGLAAYGVRAQTPTLVDQDVGAPKLKGSMTTTTNASGGKVYTIVGGGHDIWDSSDDFH